MSSPGTLERSAGFLLLAAVFLLAVCGLIYELIAGTLSSYLLGDSVTQWSLVIGLFLTAMGGGAFLSKFVTRRLLAAFILVEIAVGMIGGSTAAIAFLTFAYTELYVPVLYTLVMLVGILVGLEIPLIIRILKEMETLRVTLAHVLSADYLGALLASVLFPFALLPHVGLVRAGFLAGLSNVLVAIILLWKLGRFVEANRRAVRAAAVVSAAILAIGFLGAGRLVSHLEDRLYQDEVILALDTPHQRLVLTRWRDDLRLYLNGHLQFSSIDEYRYHEALVHPAMSAARLPARVLILGGGDGLAAREVARYPEVEQIEVVDIDPVVTELFSTREMLRDLNQGILNDRRVRVHNTDALEYLKDSMQLYDVVLMDLPDPSEPALGKLYSQAFFRLAVRHLTDRGVLATQATSPFRSREAFWCIVNTLESVQSGDGRSLEVRPYHSIVPTFGTWGFVMAGHSLPPVEGLRIRVPARYLSEALLPGLFVFPADMARLDTPISRLNDPVIVRLYRQGYHKYLD